MKLLLLCVCVALAHGLAPLRQPRYGERVLPDSWVVAIKEGSDPWQVKAGVSDVFARSRLPRPSVETLVDLASPVLLTRIPPQLMDQVRNVDGIDYLQADVLGELHGSQPHPSWGLDRIDSRKGCDGFYNYNDQRQGKGVNVFIMDTGVQESHAAFGGRATTLYGGQDDHGHGTHCSGTFAGSVFGIARRANILSVKSCNLYGSCPLSEMLKGFEAIFNHTKDNPGVDSVVSMSLGFRDGTGINDNVQMLLDSGVVVSVSAGNSNYDACYYSPGKVPGAITVGATDENDNRAYFSNYGKCVDIFAPGVAIWSAGMSADSNNAMTSKSGTSMACPHVTGAAAVYLGEHPGASPKEVTEAILTSATDDVISDIPQDTVNKLLYIDPN